MDAGQAPCGNAAHRPQQPDAFTGAVFFYELDKETMGKLADIIDLQFKMIELSRKHGRKKEHQIAFCLDDISDNPRFSKSPLLTKLYRRGRDANITTVRSVHRSRGLSCRVRRIKVSQGARRSSWAGRWEAVCRDSCIWSGGGAQKVGE